MIGAIMAAAAKSVFSLVSSIITLSSVTIVEVFAFTSIICGVGVTNTPLESASTLTL